MCVCVRKRRRHGWIKRWFRLPRCGDNLSRREGGTFSIFCCSFFFPRGFCSAFQFMGMHHCFLFRIRFTFIFFLFLILLFWMRLAHFAFWNVKRKIYVILSFFGLVLIRMFLNLTPRIRSLLLRINYYDWFNLGLLLACVWLISELLTNVLYFILGKVTF